MIYTDHWLSIIHKIKKESDVLVVIGIGGSYLGARAVIESLTNTFDNLLPESKRKHPQILYVGNNLSPNYINDLILLYWQQIVK